MIGSCIERSIARSIASSMAAAAHIGDAAVMTSPSLRAATPVHHDDALLPRGLLEGTPTANWLHATPSPKARQRVSSLGCAQADYDEAKWPTWLVDGAPVKASGAVRMSETRGNVLSVSAGWRDDDGCCGGDCEAATATMAPGAVAHSDGRLEGTNGSAMKCVGVQHQHSPHGYAADPGLCLRACNADRADHHNNDGDARKLCGANHSDERCSDDNTGNGEVDGEDRHNATAAHTEPGQAPSDDTDDHGTSLAGSCSEAAKRADKAAVRKAAVDERRGGDCDAATATTAQGAVAHSDERPGGAKAGAAGAGDGV